MKGWFVKNYYYSDEGIDYIFNRLKKSFSRYNVELEEKMPVLCYDEFGRTSFEKVDFVVFWDKDVRLAAALERSGIKVFNSSKAIALCDDKETTYSAIEGTNISIPKTVSAPLAYSSALVESKDFLLRLKKTLTFPFIAKENHGSQGKQVYLIKNEQELNEFYSKMFDKAHHYQQYFAESKGRDYRYYCLGGKVIACGLRENTTDFKSNVCQGAKMSLLTPNPEFVAAAEEIARRLGLAYGSVDFLALEKPVFLEANSNAYFKAIEGLNVDIAGEYAKYILNKIAT